MTYDVIDLNHRHSQRILPSLLFDGRPPHYADREERPDSNGTPNG